MVTAIHRAVDVQRLVEREQAQLVEVLPGGDYDHLHIPGALNLPLKELDRERAATLERDRPVIVYCNDAL